MTTANGGFTQYDLVSLHCGSIDLTQRTFYPGIIGDNVIYNGNEWYDYNGAGFEPVKMDGSPIRCNVAAKCTPVAVYQPSDCPTSLPKSAALGGVGYDPYYGYKSWIAGTDPFTGDPIIMLYGINSTTMCWTKWCSWLG